MLNYVWISLLLIGIFTAVGRDINDEASNTYRNGIVFNAQYEITGQQTALRPTREIRLRIPASVFNKFYNSTSALSEIDQPAIITTLASGKQK